MLSEGYSSLDTEMAVIVREPFAATWLQHEDRTPLVRLAANTNYWDKDRGPHLSEVVFRNDLEYEDALELVCSTEGEVDIVTMVPPEAAKKVENSEHAKLVAHDGIYSVAGIINRDTEGLPPLSDKRARKAMNLAIDRGRIVREAMFGHASPLAGLTPDSALPEENPLSPYAHDPDEAARLWNEAGGENTRPIRIAAFEENGRVARAVARDLEASLGVDTEVVVHPADAELRVRRRLAEKKLPHEWDVFIFGHGAQSADGVALELHRAFVGKTGELRAGAVLPEFEALMGELFSKTDPTEQAEVSARIDRFVHDEALALFLAAPQSLYAVNDHVDFTPYRVTFELADTRMGEEHWSLR
jgi:peptide/nickel transport system substrate-binding protein